MNFSIYLKKYNEIEKFPFSSDVAELIVPYEKDEVLMHEFDNIIGQIRASDGMTKFSKTKKEETIAALQYVYKHKDWRIAAAKCQTIIIGYADFKLVELNNKTAANSYIMVIKV